MYDGITFRQQDTHIHQLSMRLGSYSNHYSICFLLICMPCMHLYFKHQCMHLSIIISLKYCTFKVVIERKLIDMLIDWCLTPLSTVLCYFVKVSLYLWRERTQRSQRESQQSSIGEEHQLITFFTIVRLNNVNFVVTAIFLWCMLNRFYLISCI